MHGIVVVAAPAVVLLLLRMDRSHSSSGELEGVVSSDRFRRRRWRCCECECCLGCFAWPSSSARTRFLHAFLLRLLLLLLLLLLLVVE